MATVSFGELAQKIVGCIIQRPDLVSWKDPLNMLELGEHPISGKAMMRVDYAPATTYIYVDEDTPIVIHDLARAALWINDAAPYVTNHVLQMLYQSDYLRDYVEMHFAEPYGFRLRTRLGGKYIYRGHFCVFVNFFPWSADNEHQPLHAGDFYWGDDKLSFGHAPDRVYMWRPDMDYLYHLQTTTSAFPQVVSWHELL